MKFLSILTAIAMIIVAWIMTSEVSALYEDHPMYQPLAHDVADIPPIEMTGQAAVAVWMKCAAVTTGWTAIPYPCEGRDLPYTRMYGYDITPAPEALTEDRDGYNDWSLDITNSRALRAFWIVDKPIYERNTTMSMLMHSTGAYQYQWLDRETSLHVYMTGEESMSFHTPLN